ncbi:MAG: hypothetical protein NXI20_01480 [bacterium]|nr:hypothetical protein [bacterium]
MEKSEKYIAVLRKQIDKLDEEDFDLEAWKSSAQSRLASIFGENDARIKQINDLKIDYSSWALRDSNSRYKPVETCKKKGREIIESLIDEIDIVGVPFKNGHDQLNSLLKEAVSEDVSKEIENYLAQDDHKGLKKYLNKLNKETLTNLLLQVLKS